MIHNSSHTMAATNQARIQEFYAHFQTTRAGLPTSFNSFLIPVVLTRMTLQAFLLAWMRSALIKRRPMH